MVTNRSSEEDIQKERRSYINEREEDIEKRDKKLQKRDRSYKLQIKYKGV